MKDEGALRVCCALLALFCAAGIARVMAIMNLHVPLDPNEGWNAYHALHAMSGAVLYPGAHTFLYNNYPPLSYYIVGSLGSLIGDNIVAGRLLSLMATLAIALAIVLSARRMRVDIDCAVFAALLFIAGLLVYTDYVGMDDPQLLGHAVAMAGLVAILKDPRSFCAVVGAALLMTIAGYIKHNLIALPLALAIWLMVYERRSAIRFLLSGIAFALAGLFVFHVATGTSLFCHLNSPRRYSIDLLTSALGSWLVWADVSLFGLAALFSMQRDDKHVVFAAIYAFIAILAGVAFAGGDGVDMNIWFDATIALSLGTALTFDRLITSDRLRAVAALVYVLPLVAGLAVSWDNAWLERDFWLRPMSSEAGMARTDVAFLKAHEGPALCETLSLCYWARKREEVDVFNLGQAYATHARSDETLVRLLKERYYKSIAFDSLADFTLTPRVRQTLLRDYRVDHQNDEGVFFLPR